MKKLVACMCICLIVSFKSVSADETNTPDKSGIEQYIFSVYSQIDFSSCGRLSFEVFDKAYHGYLNLRTAGKLNKEKEIISICDFTLPSTENRLWIIDLSQKKVLYNTYVAHGQGSGDDYATSFSNDFNSHQSSLGFYVTGDTYDGEHGTSLHLTGMDEGYNDAAYDRGIVIHGAAYVCDKFVCTHQQLGRSWGCPAVPERLSLPIINTVKGGTCLFIYYPDSKYMKNAYWLNKQLPSSAQENIYADISSGAIDLPHPAAKTIKYFTNGKLDSVKVIPFTTLIK